MHQLVKRHHGRNRIAGQSEEQGIADAAEGERPTGFHGDLPEADRPHLFQRCLHVVGIADGNATRCHDRVRLCGRFRKRAFDVSRFVAHHPHVDGLDANACQHAVNRVPVAVVNLPRFQRLTDTAEFIAGREKSDARTATHADFGDANRGQHPQFRGHQQGAGPQRDRTRRDILAGLAHVLAVLLAGADRRPVFVARDLFLHDHRVRTLRQRCTG